MWHIVLYCLIFVKHFVIALDTRYRPAMGMTNYQQQSLDVFNPGQPTNDEYMRMGVVHSHSVGRGAAWPQNSQNYNNMNYNILRQSNNMQQPIQPPIRQPYQISMQTQYKVPEKFPVRFSVQRPPALRIESGNQPLVPAPFNAPNRMTVEQSDYNLQRDTWPTVPTTTTTASVKRSIKRVRKSRLRNNKATKKKPSTLRILKLSSSTRPPYPGGIRPETKEVEGDYIMCDGNAICHKYVWTTQKNKVGRRSDVVLIKSFINK